MGRCVPLPHPHARARRILVAVDSEGRPLADLNHDSAVDLRDFAILQRDFFAP